MATEHPAQDIARFRDAAAGVDDDRVRELIGWYRAVEGLPAVEWSRAGAYRQAVTELRADHAAALLRDLRRAARDPKARRHGADGKPVFAGGRTLRQCVTSPAGE